MPHVWLLLSTCFNLTWSHAVCVLGDSLSSLQKAVEQKETSRQQLREQLDAVERETRAKLLEIDAFNTQLKVNSQLVQDTVGKVRSVLILYN